MAGDSCLKRSQSSKILCVIFCIMLNLIDDINKIWQELQHEKVRMKHQEEHLQEILQNAFDEVSCITGQLLQP